MVGTRTPAVVGCSRTTTPSITGPQATHLPEFCNSEFTPGAGLDGMVRTVSFCAVFEAALRQLASVRLLLNFRANLALYVCASLVVGKSRLPVSTAAAEM